MKRRLSVAIALVGEPKIIFLDEPTTGLDPGNRKGLIDILMKLRGKRAIIITTHSMEEADVLCSRIGDFLKRKNKKIKIFKRNYHKWNSKMYRTSSEAEKLIWEWVSSIC